MNKKWYNDGLNENAQFFFGWGWGVGGGSPFRPSSIQLTAGLFKKNKE